MLKSALLHHGKAMLQIDMKVSDQDQSPDNNLPL